MTIQQGLGQLAGRPDLLMWRPSGKFLRVKNSMAMVVPWPDRERTVIFVFSDLVTDDWKVGTLDQMRKDFPADAAERAA
jgi:hypothetical protein